MSVEKFRIQNFMGFENSGWLELRSISLLFGRNSTGKSSIIRALLLLKQSLVRSLNNEPLNFLAENGRDFGSFETMVRDHDVEKEMAFWFWCKYEQRNEHDESRESFDEHGLMDEMAVGALLHTLGSDGLPAKHQSSREVQVRIRLGFRYELDTGSAKLNAVDMYDQHGDVLLQATAPINGDQESGWTFFSDFFDYEQLVKSEPIWPFVSIFPQHGFLPGIRSAEEGISMLTPDFLPDDLSTPYDSPSGLGDKFDIFVRLLSSVRIDIADFLNNIYYLGPIREAPQRYYYFGGIPDSRMDATGKRLLQEFMRRGQDPNDQQANKVKQWLADSSFKVRPEPQALDKAETLFELRLHETNDNASVASITDVGFGISQILPIIIQSFFAPNNITLLLEQPELHLHPSAQAEIADIFIATQKRGIKILIETHSENLLLRFRRRIAEATANQSPDQDKLLTLDHFNALFVDRQDEGSRVHELVFDKWGDYVTRPQGYGDFFGQDFEELANMKKARIRGATS